MKKVYTDRKVVWIGDSKKRLKEFPEEVQKGVGYALHFAQNGDMHPHIKPFKGLGSGLFEIVEDFLSSTYRAVAATYMYYMLFRKNLRRG